MTVHPQHRLTIMLAVMAFGFVALVGLMTLFVLGVVKVLAG